MFCEDVSLGFAVGKCVFGEGRALVQPQTVEVTPVVCCAAHGVKVALPVFCPTSSVYW